MEKVWLNHYDPGVDLEIEAFEERNMGEYFDNVCDKYSDKIAFSNSGCDLRYSEVKQYAHYFATFLRHTLKLKKNDRVAIMLPNSLQYPIVLLACLKAGYTVVNVNPLYTSEELKFQLQDSGADTLIVLSNFADTVEKATTSLAIKNIIITDFGDLLGYVKGCFIQFFLKYIKCDIPKHRLKNTISFKKALRIGKKFSNSVQLPVVNLTDIAFLQYTGGTTGTSKAAVLSHHNILSNIKQSAAWIRQVTTEGKDIVITGLPLYHIFSLTINCLLFLNFGAQNVLVTNPRDLNTFIKILRQYSFTTMTGVNTLFDALLNHPDFKSLDFKPLKLTLSGGMSVQETVAKKWEAVTKKPLIEAYGLTETSPGAIINPMSSSGFNGSVGLPLPDTDIKLCDEDDQEVSFNTPGELHIKGPQVMVAYWNRPDETQHCLVDGWLKTGDIACVDERGYVKIVDRKKEMILVSGFNVYPNQVEQVLNSFDGIKEVGVVGEKLDDNLEQVVAYIVKSDLSLTIEAVIEYAREYLVAYKVPKKIIFIDELPKTNVGKVSRKELKQMQKKQS